MSGSRRFFPGGISVDAVDYNSMCSIIENAITENRKLKITYLNASCFNILYKNDRLKKLAEGFDVIHPDGVGIYLAAKLIFGSSAFTQRFTGSDFYPLLWNNCIKNQRSMFFFGHDEDTLGRIRNNIPGLKIAGVHNGYSYNDNEVVEKVNSSHSDVLVIGLGYPLQEEWVIENFSKLNCRVIICAGEGIKVFAGSKKRGPRFLQVMGLEWLVRLMLNPLKYFRRYVIGIPLFLYRIITIKIRNLA